MSLAEYASSYLVDTGETLALEVCRLVGADNIVIGVGTFAFAFPAGDAALIIGAIARAIDEDRQTCGEIAVVELVGVDVGFGMSNDGHWLWINCAPFHIRIARGVANVLMARISEVAREWRTERTIARSTLPAMEGGAPC